MHMPDTSASDAKHNSGTGIRGQTDEQVLGAFARGDDLALAELARRYEGPLLGLARGLLNGREDAARDAVQDTWVRVIKSAKHFAGRSSVKTWLYRILINRSHDLRADLARMNGHAPNVAESVHEGAGSAAMAGERSDALRLAVESLPEDRRLILLLSYHEGLTHDAAAKVLDIPVGTLKSRLHGALEELRARMGREGS
jgi:RNA polymerase sigma-70 factor (ECF subfamily)